MSKSRSHQKNPSPSSNRHDGRKSWDAITKDEPSSPNHLVWLPEGEDLGKMSATVRRAVAEIAQPVYEELVAQAHTAMEKSLGLFLVHCLWL
jgi:hypothetical protein